jgi:hypothetical protein
MSNIPCIVSGCTEARFFFDHLMLFGALGITCVIGVIVWSMWVAWPTPPEPYTPVLFLKKWKTIDDLPASFGPTDYSADFFEALVLLYPHLLEMAKKNDKARDTMSSVEAYYSDGRKHESE